MAYLPTRTDMDYLNMSITNTLKTNNATNLAISPCGEDNYPFDETVQRIAAKKHGGLTLERQVLNGQALRDAVAQDFRMHFPAIYGKTDRLPSAIFSKISESVDRFIESHLRRVNASNCISLRRGYHFSERNMAITERISTIGENSLKLSEQLAGINQFIKQTEERLKEYYNKTTPDYDREKQLKASLVKYGVAKTFIEKEIDHQAKLDAELKAKEAQA